MNEEVERRLASNEAVFREVNEGISRGQWPGDPGHPVAFRCECARLGCNVLLPLTLGEYREIRAHPHRFFMVPGHEMPEIERLVSTHGQHVVVEKIGEGADEVLRRDPGDR